jgi:hypothetical protein
MSEGSNIMEVVAGISAIAAVFSAVAAFFAWKVADKAYHFNRNLVLNKSELKVLDELIESLIKLKAIRQLSPLEMPDDDFLNAELLLNNVKAQMDSLCNSNKQIETTVKSWLNQPEGKILVLIKSKIPWKEIKESEPDFLDKIIDYFKEVKNDLL